MLKVPYVVWQPAVCTLFAAAACCAAADGCVLHSVGPGFGGHNSLSRCAAANAACDMITIFLQACGNCCCNVCAAACHVIVHHFNPSSRRVASRSLAAAPLPRAAWPTANSIASGCAPSVPSRYECTSTQHTLLCIVSGLTWACCSMLYALLPACHAAAAHPCVSCPAAATRFPRCLWFTIFMARCCVHVVARDGQLGCVLLISNHLLL